MDSSNFDNAEHTLKQVKEAMSVLLSKAKDWDKKFSSMSKEDQKQLGSAHSDVSKMINMIKSGNFDSDFINKITGKNANKGNQ